MKHFLVMARKAPPLFNQLLFSQLWISGIRTRMQSNDAPLLTANLSHILRSLIIVLLLGVQLGCTATTLPPYEATYTTKLRGIKINGIRKFENTANNSYKVSWKAKALWMRLNEWSEFELIDGKKIRPISYHYTRKGLGTDKPIHILFDWDNMLINASKGDKQYQFTLEPNTLDRLSYQVQMQIDLLINPDSKQLNYTVANHDKLAHYAFNFEQQELIETELGKSLSKVFKREKKDKITRIWLSAEQYYVPVKIEQTEDDKSSVIAIKHWQSKADKSGLGLITLVPSPLRQNIIGSQNLASSENINTNLTEDNSTTLTPTLTPTSTPSPTPSIDDKDFDGDF